MALRQTRDNNMKLSQVGNLQPTVKGKQTDGRMDRRQCRKQRQMRRVWRCSGSDGDSDSYRDTDNVGIRWQTSERKVW